MTEGRKVRVTVRTASETYEGNLLIPPMRNRVSDVLNDDDTKFINLTDVRINKADASVPFVSINKNMIESIIE
jgi:hypothetical protein